MTTEINWIRVRSAIEAELDAIAAIRVSQVTRARMLAETTHELLKESIGEEQLAGLLLARLVNFEQFAETYCKRAKTSGVSVSAYLARMLVHDLMLE